MIPIIFPYKMGSGSAKALAQELNTKRVRANGRYRPKADHLIINWGNSNGPTSWPTSINKLYGAWLNPVIAVATASNKLTALRVLEAEDVSTPRFTTQLESAQAFFNNTGRVYCRKILTGHSGNGIIVAETPEQLIPAPLYTAGITGYREEFRIHVFHGNIIDTQQKKRKLDADKNSNIRNHHTGWIYARQDVVVSKGIQDLALHAVRALQLDFGAVDIIAERDNLDNCWVLEVNTAPGLKGTTLNSYVNAIKEML